MRNKRKDQLALFSETKPAKKSSMLVPYHSSTLALVKPQNLRSLDAPPL